MDAVRPLRRLATADAGRRRAAGRVVHRRPEVVDRQYGLSRVRLGGRGDAAGVTPQPDGGVNRPVAPDGYTVSSYS